MDIDNDIPNPMDDDFWDVPSDDGEYWDDEWGLCKPIEDLSWDIDDLPETVVEPDERQQRHKQLEADGWIEVKQYDGIVPDDVIYFEDTIWEKGSYPSLPIGSRSNTVRVTKKKYDINCTERISFEVIESIGCEALDVGQKRWKKRGTISNIKSYRKLWDDESLRKKALEDLEAEYQKSFAEWSKQESLKQEVSLDVINSIPISGRSYDEDREKVLTELPDDEQQWVLWDWHKDVDLDEATVEQVGQWNPELGWKQLHNTKDTIVVGDIVLYWHPFFSRRYPYGKLLGTTMVIAKVTKLGRKYCYCDCICSYDGSIEAGKSIGPSFGYVAYWGTYRLYWNNEYLRMKELERKCKMSFSTVK